MTLRILPCLPTLFLLMFSFTIYYLLESYMILCQSKTAQNELCWTPPEQLCKWCLTYSVEVLALFYLTGYFSKENIKPWQDEVVFRRRRFLTKFSHIVLRVPCVSLCVRVCVTWRWSKSHTKTQRRRNVHSFRKTRGSKTNFFLRISMCTNLSIHILESMCPFKRSLCNILV